MSKRRDSKHEARRRTSVRWLAGMAPITGLTLVLAACGGGGSKTSTAAQPAATPAPTSKAQSAPTSTATSGPTVMEIANPKLGKILANANDMVLYIYTADKGGKERVQRGMPHVLAAPAAALRRHPGHRRGRSERPGNRERTRRHPGHLPRDAPLHLHRRQRPQPDHRPGRGRQRRNLVRGVTVLPGHRTAGDHTAGHRSAGHHTSGHRTAGHDPDNGRERWRCQLLSDACPFVSRQSPCRYMALAIRQFIASPRAATAPPGRPDRPRRRSGSRPVHTRRPTAATPRRDRSTLRPEHGTTKRSDQG